MTQLGIEQLLNQEKQKKALKGRKLGLIAHPASVNHKLEHSLDLLLGAGLKVSCGFGAQHGIFGEKQDNMIESDDVIDPKYQIPVYSLYGKVRRPTPKMLEGLDVLVFDLQDVGCRIYTFLTTLFYVMEDAEAAGLDVWVLDRPNPAGRPIEGSLCSPEYFSFVGAAELVMRHGLTLGEAALWYKSKKKLNLNLQIVKMKAYDPTRSRQLGWPSPELSWVNPSPNMPQVSTARMYSGTVLLEGTSLSEGRGTTRPLEVLAAPDLDGESLIREVYKVLPKKYHRGFKLRSCYFEPTFQKHAKALCSGFQIHIDQPDYDHEKFKPYRIVCAALKAIRNLQPDYPLWNPPPFEYEEEKLPIDILAGDDGLRLWVDDSSAEWGDLEAKLTQDERAWKKESRKFHLYKS